MIYVLNLAQSISQSPSPARSLDLTASARRSRDYICPINALKCCHQKAQENAKKILIFNWDAVRHLGFNGKWMLSTARPQRSTLHQRTKCQQNRQCATQRWVIDEWQVFLDHYCWGGGRICPSCSEQLSVRDDTKLTENSPIICLPTSVLDLRYIDIRAF